MCACCPARPAWCACVAALVWAPSPWPGWVWGGPGHQPPVPRRNIEDNVRAAGAPLLAHAGWKSPSPCPRAWRWRARRSTPAWAFWAASPSWAPPASSSRIPPRPTAPAWCRRAGGGHAGPRRGGAHHGRAHRAVCDERARWLPPACFVQMGDFLRYALDEAVAQGLTGSRHWRHGGQADQNRPGRNHHPRQPR